MKEKPFLLGEVAFLVKRMEFAVFSGILGESSVA